MIVLDTSAVMAWLEQEPEAERIEALFLSGEPLGISAGTMVETGIVVESRRGEAGGRELDLFLHRLGVAVVPLDREHVELARAAYRRFGKGRHPAGLNLGDCFSYALAASTGSRLLYVGDDFTKTDITAALAG